MLFDTFRQARTTVDSFTRQRIAQGHEPTELALTELFLSAICPPASYSQFTQRAESITGSDWVWWWTDGTEWFGSLVQAKRLHRSTSGYRIDIMYNNGLQKETLKDAARLLEVVPLYCIFAGPTDFRLDVNCGNTHVRENCLRCESLGVAVVPAIAAERPYVFSQTGDSAARKVLTVAACLEDLALPATPLGDSRVPDLNLNHQNLDPDVRAFLMQPQTGVRNVAKDIFKIVSELRSLQFSAATLDATLESGVEDAVFRVLPEDRGHFSESYFHHCLRGLRRRPPAYVDSILQGEEAKLPPNVSGVTIIRM